MFADQQLGNIFDISVAQYPSGIKENMHAPVMAWRCISQSLTQIAAVIQLGQAD